MNKLKVIVCGAVFGQIYIKGINMNEKYELVGILSNGSKLSNDLSNIYGVPLYTDISNIPINEIDLVCVVVRSTIVGGVGTNIAKFFLERGLSVIQEQPVHLKEVMSNTRLANIKNTNYLVNSFYPYFPSVVNMLDAINKIKLTNKVYSINCSCGIQILFPTLDILSKIIGKIEIIQILGMHQNSDFEKYIYLNIENVFVMLRVFNKNNYIGKDNPITSIFNIDISTDLGDLYLTDVCGYLIWNNKPLIIENYLKNKYNPRGEELINNNIYSFKENSFKESFNSEWPKSVSNYLNLYYELLNNKEKKLEYYNNMVNVLKLWNKISLALESRY